MTKDSAASAAASPEEDLSSGLAACVVDPELNNSKRPKRTCTNTAIAAELEETKEALA